MQRTILTIAAIVAAITVYNRTAATSSEPAPRTVSGGPTIVFLEFSDQFSLGCEPLTRVEFETEELAVTAAAEVVWDMMWSDQGWMDEYQLLLINTATMEETVVEEYPTSFSTSDRFDIGGALVLPEGTYVLRFVTLTCCSSCSAPALLTYKGWLRLQIFGCDSPAGCIPGDLNLDGRVDLLDFATFADNFQG